MKTKIEIISKLRAWSDGGDRYPRDEVEVAMDEWAKQSVIAFTKWTLEGDCNYSATDEDQWTHTETGDSINTEQLYEVFLKSKPLQKKR